MHMSTNNHRISLISYVAFQYATRHRSSAIFALAISAILEHTKDPAKHPEYPANLVPTQYHDLLLLFAKKGPDKLPPYLDHEIPIGDNKPPIGRMYSMLASELQEIQT